MPAALVLLSMLVVPQGNPAATPAAPAVVRGQVVNSRTRVPVADALVALAEIAVSQRTTPTGHFEFSNVAPGTYTLTVSTVGYIFVRRTITVPADAPADLTVPIAEGTGTYEESVDVTATAASEASLSAITMSSAALQDVRDVAADDPVRAMQALPGVATGDDFRAEFSVRGSAFRHVGIVIDGSATSLLFHTMGGVEDPGSIAMINTDVVERATLSTGIHPQEHGNWIGATLAFDIREGSRDRRGVRAGHQRHQRIDRLRRPTGTCAPRIVAGLGAEELRGLAHPQDRTPRSRARSDSSTRRPKSATTSRRGSI